MAETLDTISMNYVARLLSRRVPQVRMPVRYQTIPRFVTENVKLQPRSFPYNLPTGPHRPHSTMSRPPALGIGSIRGLKEKKKKELTAEEPSKKLPPIKKKCKNEKELLLFPETASRSALIDEEEKRENDDRGVSLPKHEDNADVVRYRAVRYEPRPEIWQRVSCVWDQVQTRPNQFHQYESDSLFPAIPTSTSRHEQDQELGTVKPVEESIRIPKMPEREGGKRNIQFTRPTPGYGGYISRYPVEPRPPKGSWDEVFVNMSKLAYRAYPSYEYTKKEFAHKGPLSRLVTTTHPSNPFNKVDKWSSGPKKLWKRAANQSKFV